MAADRQALVTALAAVVVSAGSRSAIETAERVLAQELGFEGDVLFSDLDRLAHAAASRPIAADLPRVLSCLEVA